MFYYTPHIYYAVKLSEPLFEGKNAGKSQENCVRVGGIALVNNCKHSKFTTGHYLYYGRVLCVAKLLQLCVCVVALSSIAQWKDLRHKRCNSQGPLRRGGGSNGGGVPIWTRPSRFVLSILFGTFPLFFGIFPICVGIVRGFSRFVLVLFLGLLTAPTRDSPERVCHTIQTFPGKSGKPPGLEPPRFTFSQNSL